ncbi:lamin-A-like isoform X2 [Mugil cephalus]|uniref:lamin-A-like isoform X1 n=1 Tax=Mugil cephalus TaxID=48193 RepID=UPI001FB77E34|nr:lamin-A-like isoform X1 [Mugil cephalus]XP_047454563.1 lamin-A-like isoform X2 [Mugil cephalus]
MSWRRTKLLLPSLSGLFTQVNELKEEKKRLEKELKKTKDEKEKAKRLKEEEKKRERAGKEVETLKRKLEIESERIKREQTQNSSSSDSQETSGDITEFIDPNCDYIGLINWSDQDKPLGGRQLKVQINNRKPITYTFDPSMKLKAEKEVTLYRPGCGQHHPDTGDLVWEELKSWMPGNRVQASLQ